MRCSGVLRRHQRLRAQVDEQRIGLPVGSAHRLLILIQASLGIESYRNGFGKAFLP
jgi:hypothetical protein